METDEIDVDDNERGWQVGVGPFTVEARAEGLSEEWAEALAVRLSQMGLTVWIGEVTRMNVNERAERALDSIPLRPGQREALLPFVRMAIKEAGREAVREFVRRVEDRAEANMEKTLVLEGAHYAAMRAELAWLDITPERGSD